VTDEEPGSTFGVEAATVEEFLRLLKEREEGEASLGGPRGATRRAVFVAQMLDQRSSSYGYPSVRRYVVAAFAYGRDLVSYRRTTSSAVELPEIASRAAERQQDAYEEIRANIERGLEGMGLDLPVYEGSLRHSAEPHEN
jgi:translation initiation factor 2B subunit (eIF-2B alpha/beta/delta family)